MSGEVTRLVPSAKITWPLGDVSTDSVKLSASINLNPIVEFSAYSGKEAAEGASKVLDTDAAALMGQAQQITFSSRNIPDCTVTLNDGDNSLEFRGFLSGPNYRMSKGMLAPGFTAVAATTLMSNLKLDIYTVPGAAKSDDPLSEGVKTVAAEVKDGNLAERLARLTTELIAYWKRNKEAMEEADTPLSTAYKERRDAANHNGPLQYWIRLLKNSQESLANEWLGKLAAQDPANNAFNTAVIGILQGTSRDFLEVVASIMGSFQLVMIPSPDGRPGKLVTMASLLTEETLPLVLPAASMFLQGDNGSSLLPVQQIVVKGVSKMLLKAGEEGSQAFQLTGGASIVGAFPLGVETSAGDVEFVPLPLYLDHVIRWATPKAYDRGGGAPTLEELKKSVQHLTNKVTQFQDEFVNKLISDYARSLYVDRALGYTRTSIQIPLNVALWPGHRYHVTNSRGEHLFDGFLSGVQHVMEKKAMGGGAAPTTTLDFTHIEFPGFNLPGLE